MASLWDFYNRLQDGKLASILVDLGLATRAPIDRKSTLGQFTLTFLHPRPDGLSSEEEYGTLCDLEDHIAAAVLDDAVTYVGRLTTNSRRQFFYYLTDPLEFEAKLNSAMARFSEYNYSLSFTDDPQWQFYLESLHPDAATLRDMALSREADRQRQANSKVVDALIGNGDVIDATRNIDHWAYFASENDRSRYIEKLANQGYRVTHLHTREPSARLQYCIQFVRTDSPSNIDEITIWLAHAATELGGEYDGWECPVVD